MTAAQKPRVAKSETNFIYKVKIENQLIGPSSETLTIYCLVIEIGIGAASADPNHRFRRGFDSED